jgi:hypothetical protein
MNAFDRPVPTLAQQTQYTADAVNASGGRPRKPVTTQAVSAALRSAGFSAGKLAGVSVLNSGPTLSKRGAQVRVYHLGPVSADATAKLDAYAAALKAAGFIVEGTEGHRPGSLVYVTVTGREG